MLCLAWIIGKNRLPVPLPLEQLQRNLSRKDFVPIRGAMGYVPRCIVVVVFPGDPPYANPQTPLSRSGAPHLGYFPQADQGGPPLPPCPSRARGRPRAPPPNGVRLAALYLFRAAQVGPSLCQPGCARLGGSPPPRPPPPTDLRAGAPPRRPRTPSPLPPGRYPFSVELSGTRHGSRPPDRRPTEPRERPRRVKKKDVSYSRPTGRLAPHPAELAWASLELAALEYRARM